MTILDSAGGNIIFPAPSVAAPVFQNINAHIVSGAAGSMNGIPVGVSSNPALTGTQSAGTRTATEDSFIVLTGSATASPLFDSGFAYNQSGAGGGPVLAGNINIAGTRVRVNLTPASRWWIGLGDDANQWDQLDNPNTTMVAVRFSAGVDTNWTFRVGTSNVAFTEVDTGIPVDTTASHTFEFQFNPGGRSGVISSITFIYDSKPNKTISTNVPALTTTLNILCAGSNKNTNGNASITNWFWDYILKAR